MHEMRVAGSIVFLGVLFLGLVSGFSNSAHAERVFVTRANGEQGQGWLFGTFDRAGDRRCWIALPAHVVGERKGFLDASLSPFNFSTEDGKIGSSGMPVSVRQSDKARALFVGYIDLAFAPVGAGFKGADCLSQLGLLELVYDVISKKRLELDVVTLSEERFDIFQMTLKRAGSQESKAIQILKPLSKQDAEDYLKGGLSGATASFSHHGREVPFAMITAAVDTAKAIRFDAIQKAFDPIRLRIISGEFKNNRKSGGSIPFEIVDLDGILLGEISNANRLRQTGSCWKMAPRGGRRSVRLTLEPNADVPISGLLFFHAPNCLAEKMKIGIGVSHNGGQSWAKMTDCVIEGNSSSQTACPFRLRGAASIRITSTARVSSLSRIAILPR